jgi:hypothetical protein
MLYVQQFFEILMSGTRNFKAIKVPDNHLVIIFYDL